MRGAVHVFDQKALRACLLPLTAMLIFTLACARADLSAPESGSLLAGHTVTSSPRATISAIQATLDPQAVPPTKTAAPIQPTPSATAESPEPLVSPTFPPTATIPVNEVLDVILYETQPGETLKSLAIRFAVLPEDISAAQGTLGSPETLVDPGRLLLIPRRLTGSYTSEWILPDSELIYSPYAADFDVVSYLQSRPGYINQYRQFVEGKYRSGPEIVAIAARDNSTNPRLLIAFLEYYAGWVNDPQVPSGEALIYPLGNVVRSTSGLYRQLTWLANELGSGYYGWRSGAVTQAVFPDGSTRRFEPSLNAGSVALQYFFSQSLNLVQWQAVLEPDGFLATYVEMFGDPWSYEHPIYQPELRQPEMILPFLEGSKWAFTGGPHGAWTGEAAWAALDLAPTRTSGGCAVSTDWATAVAPGLIIRSEAGVVVLDLDGDGREQTGWVVLYLHIATQGRVELGTFVETGDKIGHPSCEGGVSTGSHIHIARKYNGEWVLADGPLPFELDGWVARAGSRAYLGALTKGDQVVLACRCASRETEIRR